MVIKTSMEGCANNYYNLMLPPPLKNLPTATPTGSSVITFAVGLLFTCENFQSMFCLPFLSKFSRDRSSKLNFNDVTSKQKSEIEASWRIIVEFYGIVPFGELMFRLFFEIDPDALSLFSSMSDKSELYESPVFKRHAKLIGEHIDKQIQQCHQRDALLRFNQKLGILHNNLFVIREKYSEEDYKNHDKMIEHFRYSKIALLAALEQILLKYDADNIKLDKDRNRISLWNEDLKAAWGIFYQLNISMMMSKIECCVRHGAV